MGGRGKKEVRIPPRHRRRSDEEDLLTEHKNRHRDSKDKW